MEERRLNCVAEASEVEIAHLDRRYDDREPWSSSLACAHANGAAHRVEVVQHVDRRIVEAKVLDRPRNAPALYEERAVARESRVENRSRIDGTKVPEARDEDAALGRCDELLGGGRAAGHAHRA